MPYLPEENITAAINTYGFEAFNTHYQTNTITNAEGESINVGKMAVVWSTILPPPGFTPFGC
jgi:tRNA G26 N,N-dimethylase Trm1